MNGIIFPNIELSERETVGGRGEGGGGRVLLHTLQTKPNIRFSQTLESVLRRGRGKSPNTESPNMEEVCTLFAIACNTQSIADKKNRTKRIMFSTTEGRLV
jgi:hypothetical protein